MTRAYRWLVLVALAFACGPAPAAQDTARAVSLIVTGGIVVTVDASRRVFSPGAIAIDGTTIAAVGPAADIAAKFKAKEQIDASGTIVIPGLVNTHTHA